MKMLLMGLIFWMGSLCRMDLVRGGAEGRGGLVIRGSAARVEVKREVAAGVGVKRDIAAPDGDSIGVKMLWGKWRDTKDGHALLIFARDYCYFQYEGDTSAAIHYHYALSTSCEVKDAVAKADADNAWLLIYSTDSDSPLRTCNEIQNLSKTTLSYMDAKTGALHVYDRVVPAKKK